MTDKQLEFQTGVVRAFDDGKGIGFIVCDDDRTQVFCHHSAIVMEGHRTLYAGQRVSFLRIPTEKRLPRAEHIELIDETEESVAA